MSKLVNYVKKSMAAAITATASKKPGYHKQVPTGTLADKNAAFVCLYSKPYKHYATAPKEWGEKALNAEIQLMGMVMRWDGTLGFPGGKVDPGETLVQAALRECVEEINLEMQPEDIELICSHEIKPGVHSHLFVREVSPEFLYAAQDNANSAEHARLEGAGFNVMHMTNATINTMLSSALAKTVKEEIVSLILADVL